MKVQINFWNGKEPLKYECENIKEAVLMAIKENTNLRSADLRSADLRSADLRSAVIPLLSMFNQKYGVWMIDNKIKIGCQLHSITKWSKFTNKEILEVGGEQGLIFWKQYKDVIISLAKLHVKKVKELSKA